MARCNNEVYIGQQTTQTPVTQAQVWAGARAFALSDGFANTACTLSALYLTAGSSRTMSFFSNKPLPKDDLQLPPSPPSNRQVRLAIRKRWEGPDLDSITVIR